MIDLEDIRKRHYPFQGTDDDGGPATYCVGCTDPGAWHFEPWPCLISRLADEVERQAWALKELGATVFTTASGETVLAYGQREAPSDSEGGGG